MRKSRKKVESIPVKAKLIKKSEISEHMRSSEVADVSKNEHQELVESGIQKAMQIPAEWLNAQLKTRTDPRKAFAALFNQSPQTQS